MFSFTSYYIVTSKIINHLSLSLRWLGRFVSKNYSCKEINQCNCQSVVSSLYGVTGIKPQNILSKLSNEDKEFIIKAADHALNNHLSILGFDLKDYISLPWNSDFIHGFTWPKGRYYTKQLSYSKGKKVDVKVPWELSRCHFCLWLAEAYCITGKEDYAKLVVESIGDWIEENPFLRSVNWTCPMDVSIRAVNWIYALSFIIDYKGCDEGFLKKTYRNLYQHGIYVYNNFCLEKGFPYSNNHYATDVVGLLFLGRLFFNTRQGKKWWDYALKEYYYEVRNQVLPSGVHYECSVSYHRLMTELFVYTYFLLQRSDENVPLDIQCRLISMLNFVQAYIDDSGKAPIVGDNDNGRFLPFIPREFESHNYLVNKKSFDWRIASLGTEELPLDDKHNMRAFKDAGFVSIKKGQYSLFICNGGICKYPDRQKRFGAHIHNDLLSFVLSKQGKPLIVDPGTYIYTYDIVMRNAFRSTRKHNTLVVDDEEQNILDKNAFYLTKNCISGILNNKKEVGIDICEGEYKTIRGGLKHTRSFVVSENEIVIEDKIQKNGLKHKAELFFHLAPKWDGFIEGNRVEVSNGGQIATFSFFSESSIEIKLFNDTVSESYGVIIPTKTISVMFTFDKLAKFKTSIKF